MHRAHPVVDINLSSLNSDGEGTPDVAQGALGMSVEIHEIVPGILIEIDRLVAVVIVRDGTPKWRIEPLGGIGLRVVRRVGRLHT